MRLRSFRPEDASGEGDIGDEPLRSLKRSKPLQS